MYFAQINLELISKTLINVLSIKVSKIINRFVDLFSTTWLEMDIGETFQEY